MVRYRIVLAGCGSMAEEWGDTPPAGVMRGLWGWWTSKRRMLSGMRRNWGLTAGFQRYEDSDRKNGSQSCLLHHNP